MSKTSRSFLLVFAASIQILHFLNNSSGQSLDAHITVDVSSAPSVTVDGRFPDKERTDPRNLFFLREYAGTTGLADRVGLIRLENTEGAAVGFTKFISGEYVADTDFQRWKYRFSLAPVERMSALAHISWLRGDRGILMLDDLLPQAAGGAKRTGRIGLTLPGGWEVTTNLARSSDGTFDVADVERAMFLITKTGVARNLTAPNTDIGISILDNWLVPDRDIAEMASQIALSYATVFGKSRLANSRVTLMRFPAAAHGNWEADTRGGNITLLSADMPFKAQSIQKLHEQLRHEIFHLWIPDGVNVSGNYDWFYEGFALYLSLKSGVAANQLRFDDLLASLGQAYTIENLQPGGISLIDASRNRWSGANTRVYSRGMIVAFLCDIALMSKSNGRRSAETLVREFFHQNQAGSKPADGNECVLKIMSSHPELAAIIASYIQGSEKINLATGLNAAGIEATSEAAFVKLKVLQKPNRKQKDLLNRLGYNQWRSLSNSLK